MTTLQKEDSIIDGTRPVTPAMVRTFKKAFYGGEDYDDGAVDHQHFDECTSAGLRAVMAGLVQDTERATFESVAQAQGHEDLKRHPDGAYRNVYLEAAWCGWQQRAAQGIPHGMALVPVEPTPAMRHAGWVASDAAQGCFNHEHGDLCPHCGDGFGQPDGCGAVAVASYRAMLKAVPEACARALPEDFVTSVHKLVMLARTSGGTAGRDEALCQALSTVEDQLVALDARS